MNGNISNILKSRTEFIGHMEEDIKKNNRNLQDTKDQKDKLQETITDVKTLAKYPEHESLIPLAKNIYMKGRIVHTGEYYVKKTAHPHSYIVLKTLEQTLNALQIEVSSKEKDVEKIEYANFQLQERLRLMKGDEVQHLNEEEFTEEEELPKEIKSEKGVAIKVGEFYEILEFEDQNHE